MGADERAVPASGAGGRHGPFRILRVDDDGLLSLVFPVILGALGLTGSFFGFMVVNVLIAGAYVA